MSTKKPQPKKRVLVVGKSQLHITVPIPPPAPPEHFHLLANYNHTGQKNDPGSHQIEIDNNTNEAVRLCVRTDKAGTKIQAYFRTKLQPGSDAQEGYVILKGPGPDHNKPLHLTHYGWDIGVGHLKFGANPVTSGSCFWDRRAGHEDDIFIP